MILVITHKEDITADIVINKLNEGGHKYFRLNTEEILSSANCLISFNGTVNSFSLDGIESFSSVWYRRIKLPQIDEQSESRKQFVETEIYSFLSNLWELIDARWMSIPHHVHRAENKLFQLRIAQSVGFTIPQTILTNDNNKIREFYSFCKERVIIKPLMNSNLGTENEYAIFSNMLKKEYVDNLQEYAAMPFILQEYIQKKNELRVTVVDDMVFAASIDSQSDIDSAIDWRRKPSLFKQAKLPKEIETKCLQIVRNLNLKYGAIDLICTPDDRYVFLEVNPNGQWGWVEFDTGMQISDALVKFLTLN